MTTKEKTLILTLTQIEQKIVRMAHEILENTYKDEQIVLVGIEGNGMELARRLHKILEAIGTSSFELRELHIHKAEPLKHPIEYAADLDELQNATVIIVDDVLNSGKTMVHAIQFLLNGSPQRLATAVLVGRFHHRYPVKADYVGLTLSTNLKEHVQVDLNANEVYLM
jgi:pyrimidine operon attenuation protein/uracil phosphoribosyltransferase